MTSSNKKIITVLVAADNAPEAASIAGQIDRHDDLSVLATAMTPAELEVLLAQHPDLGLLVTDAVLSNRTSRRFSPRRFRRIPNSRSSSTRPTPKTPS